MPVITICLYDDSLFIKYEVWLPSVKHRFMHLEYQSMFNKFIIKRFFNTGHPSWEFLTKPSLSDFLSAFWREFSFFVCNPEIEKMSFRFEIACVFYTVYSFLAHFIIGPRVFAVACFATKYSIFLDGLWGFLHQFSTTWTFYFNPNIFKTVFCAALERTKELFSVGCMFLKLFTAVFTDDRLAIFAILFAWGSRLKTTVARLTVFGFIDNAVLCLPIKRNLNPSVSRFFFYFSFSAQGKRCNSIFDLRGKKPPFANSFAAFSSYFVSVDASYLPLFIDLIRAFVTWYISPFFIHKHLDCITIFNCFHRSIIAKNDGISKSKPVYWRSGVKYCQDAETERSTPSLFGATEATADAYEMEVTA